MKDLLEFKLIIDDDSMGVKTRTIRGHVKVVIGDHKIAHKGKINNKMHHL